MDLQNEKCQENDLGKYVSSGDALWSQQKSNQMLMGIIHSTGPPWLLRHEVHNFYATPQLHLIESKPSFATSIIARFYFRYVFDIQDTPLSPVKQYRYILQTRFFRSIQN